MDWRELHEIIASCDINLMPLEDTVFHRAKSENKWMEAAFSEVPTIASYNTEIAANTIDRENIILCDNAIEWREQLDKMISDKMYRERIARSAFEYVMDNKMTIQCSDLRDMLNELV